MNVLITGASAGFGKALAERLVANGHRVVGCARRIDKLNALADTLGENFLPVVMDVSDTDSIPQIIADLPDDFKQIDVLVNNAGLALGTEPAHKASLDDLLTSDFATPAFHWESFDFKITACFISHQARKLFGQCTKFISTTVFFAHEAEFMTD